MKRNRGGEQDLDHIIAAAVRGMDRAVLEYPQVRAGLIFCLDRAFELRAERDHRRQGDRLAQPRRGGGRHRRPGVARLPLRRLPRPVRRGAAAPGSGVTVHAGETGGAGGGARGGRGARARPASVMASAARDDASVLAMLRERGMVLEVCPSSNLEHARRSQRTPRCARSCAPLVDNAGPLRPLDRWAGDAALATSATSWRMLLRQRDPVARGGRNGRSPPARDGLLVDRAPVHRRRPAVTDGRDNGHAADRPRGRGLGWYPAGRVLDLAADPRTSGRPQPDGHRRPSRRRGVRIRGSHRAGGG